MKDGNEIVRAEALEIITAKTGLKTWDEVKALIKTPEHNKGFQIADTGVYIFNNDTSPDFHLGLGPWARYRRADSFGMYDFKI